MSSNLLVTLGFVEFASGVKVLRIFLPESVWESQLISITFFSECKMRHKSFPHEVLDVVQFDPQFQNVEIW